MVYCIYECFLIDDNLNSAFGGNLRSKARESYVDVAFRSLRFKEFSFMERKRFEQGGSGRFCRGGHIVIGWRTQRTQTKVKVLRKSGQVTQLKAKGTSQ